VASLKPAAQAAQAHGLKLGLYNHGGWWGSPRTRLRVIEGLEEEGIRNVGIVSNLHHGHEHLERFPQMLQKMLPYLICLNLNGMDIQGQTKGRKILPNRSRNRGCLSFEDHPRQRYQGLIGILNHTGEDAEARLWITQRRSWPRGRWMELLPAASRLSVVGRLFSSDSAEQSVGD